MAKYLLGSQEDPISIPITHIKTNKQKPGMVADTCNPNTVEVEISLGFAGQTAELSWGTSGPRKKPGLRK